ncbi:hypothetical protein MNBD_ACTINO02-2966 [hydrothermal vent metagenome]|uniref:Uncharacterized protein n=1 Tax=hydrothermal vent metagenome TaxID=652676 RepID=A0A3B0RUJ9_9ZZZZ
MVNRGHHSDYDGPATERCERALVTLIGDIGPRSDRVTLVGGLSPRYIVDSIPADVPAHVGTADVDLVLGLSLGDTDTEAYRTLHNNLVGSGFSPAKPSFRRARIVDGVTVAVEFLGETSDVQPGRVFRPRGGSGSRLAALNVPCSSLAIRDSAPVQITAARLDDGGESTVTMQVAGILRFVALKILAFQDRHQNKDAYDLVYSMLYFEGGPEGAADAASASPIRSEPLVGDAVDLLGERFETIDKDGPRAYTALTSATVPHLLRIGYRPVADVATCTFSIREIDTSDSDELTPETLQAPARMAYNERRRSPHSGRLRIEKAAQPCDRQHCPGRAHIRSPSVCDTRAPRDSRR